METLNNNQLNTNQLIVKKCDTCNRSTTISINNNGLDLINRCNITLGCLGRLRLVLNLQTNSSQKFNSLPSKLDDLRDWVQRKILHTHEQRVPSTAWEVIHNMGVNPAIQVFAIDGNNNQIEIKNIRSELISNNIVRILFDEPQIGIAQVYTLDSKNIINPKVIEPIIAKDMIITHNGELTIFTTDNSPSITINIIFSNPITGNDVSINYTDVDNIASINSAWVGTTKVFLLGKTYTVRSFNIFNHPNAVSSFANDDIIDGSSVRFTETTFKNQLIGLSNEPHTIIDQITNQTIDVLALSNNIPKLIFNNGNLITQPDILKDVYPPIFK